MFDRLPDVRVVLGDVSVHGARSLLIRTDKAGESDVEFHGQGADQRLALAHPVRQPA